MSLLNRLFSRNSSSDARHSLRRHKKNCSKDRSHGDLRPQFEKLEDKIALAAQAFSVLDEGGLDGGWHVIVLDNNLDDLHLKVSQTTGELQGAQPIVTEDIVFDTEPGFTDPAGTLQHVPGFFRDILITNGVRNGVNPLQQNPRGNGGFFIDLPTADEAGLTPANTRSSQSAVVPGTIRGQVFIPDARAGDFFEFTTFRLQDEGTPQDVLVFRDGQGAWSNSITITHSIRERGEDGKITIVDKTFTVDGDVDYYSGNLTVDFETAEDFALEFDFTPRVTYASPIIPDGPSTVRLAPGLDLHAGLLIDLPSEDSVINIESPVLPEGEDNLVVLAATNVEVDAPITTNKGFYTVGSTGDFQGFEV